MNAILGNKFYRVGYNGSLQEYKIIEFKNDEPVYEIRGLLDLSNEQYKIKTEATGKPKYKATSQFGIEVMIKNPNEWFENLDIAKKVSRKRWDIEVDPNGEYRVARCFDDVFEAFVTGILTKKEAYEKKESFNKEIRHYVSYRVYHLKIKEATTN